MLGSRAGVLTSCLGGVGWAERGQRLSPGRGGAEFPPLQLPCPLETIHAAQPAGADVPAIRGLFLSTF